MIDVVLYGCKCLSFLMDCITGPHAFTMVANCVLHKPLSLLLCNNARCSCWVPGGRWRSKVQEAVPSLEKSKKRFQQLLRCFKFTTPPNTNSHRNKVKRN